MGETVAHTSKVPPMPSLPFVAVSICRTTSPSVARDFNVALDAVSWGRSPAERSSNVTVQEYPRTPFRARDTETDSPISDPRARSADAKTSADASWARGAVESTPG